MILSEYKGHAYKHKHTHTHTRTHARTHARARAHTRTHVLFSHLMPTYSLDCSPKQDATLGQYVDEDDQPHASAGDWLDGHRRTRHRATKRGEREFENGYERGAYYVEPVSKL